MKTILVPIDYSEVAENALQYAIQLATFNRAKLVLLHVYQVPVPTGEMPVMLVSPQELKEDNQKRIQKLEKKLTAENGNTFEIQSVIREGFPVDEIGNVAKEKNADLVVMGITGGGALTEKLIGSHTYSFARKTQIPVLIVPAQARFKKIERILLAYDLQEASNVAALEKFKMFAGLFNASVIVLSIEKPVAVSMDVNTPAGKAIKNSLQGIEHRVFFSPSEDPTEEINSFAQSHNCDWVAMIPHKHSVWDRLFSGSQTKKMAFHTHVPLLSIHD